MEELIMGCDIHIYCEHRQEYRGKKEWQSADFFMVDSHRDYNVVEIYDGRSYDLFAILANVRNRSWITPIDEPRGVPKDSCPQIMQEYVDWLGDAHSASYFTLRELMNNREKYRVVKRSGIISNKQNEELKNGITPNCWSQSTNAPDCVYAEWEDDVDILGWLIDPMIERARIVYRIYDFYKQEEVDKRINEIADDFRIVFWFDN